MSDDNEIEVTLPFSGLKIKRDKQSDKHPAFDELMREIEDTQQELLEFEKSSVNFEQRMNLLVKEFHKDKYYKNLLED